ncbi:MAG: exodeoxyribonuclease VII large subunit [Rhodovarius sp.]|nr:exodeoxyribonuclease VII large subunit [Rhodovarius sp.]
MESRDNIPEYAVGEIALAIKSVLRESFPRVRVRGEVTECKRYASGHIYLSLKDEEAKLEAVIWKTTLRNLAFLPENGLEVVATGRIDTYPDRSRYQLIIEQLDHVGEGALLARIERLRQKLLAEGLFDPARKRPLPLLPRLVGVITSEQGAVIQDIRTTIARRFPRPILLWPVPVQGQGAAEQIAAAIAGMGSLPPELRPDVLIVARGGGSLEDLMAFNDEAVVRAAAACPIPLISAVGHETDTTLIDFAADRRAPTPTAAAEMAVPARIELLADLGQRATRLDQAMAARLQRLRLQLVEVERRLPPMPDLLGNLRQRIDDRSQRLAQAMAALLAARRAQLAALHLPHPREGIARRRQELAILGARLQAALSAALARRAQAVAAARFSPAPIAALLRERRERLAGLAARLEASSHTAVLARGFVLVEDARGAPITTAAAVRPGQALTLHFHDGRIPAHADRPRGDARQERLL